MWGRILAIFAFMLNISCLDNCLLIGNCFLIVPLINLMQKEDRTNAGWIHCDKITYLFIATKRLFDSLQQNERTIIPFRQNNWRIQRFALTSDDTTRPLWQPLHNWYKANSDNWFKYCPERFFCITCCWGEGSHNPPWLVLALVMIMKCPEPNSYLCG